MAKKGRPDPAAASEGGGFDMTPMIDVTFLLIIFFMCVTEMADSSKSKLTLPAAVKAIPDDEVIPGRLVINVLKDGKVEINQEPYPDAQLKRTFDLHYKFGLKQGASFSDKAVLIRADRAVEFGAVQRVMGLLMESKLWRIAFSTRDPSFDKAPTPSQP